MIERTHQPRLGSRIQRRWRVVIEVKINDVGSPAVTRQIPVSEGADTDFYREAKLLHRVQQRLRRRMSADNPNELVSERSSQDAGGGRPWHLDFVDVTETDALLSI